MSHRDQLLAAARRLLEERGYARITARDLVAASDTNLASIGYHFGSKDALLNEAIAAAFDDWAAQLADFAMSAPDATPLERAGATWVASFAALPERGHIVAAYVESLAQAMRVPELRAQLAAHYRRARAMVAELVAQAVGGETDPRLCRSVAALVIAACDGLAVQWLLDPDDVPTPDELAQGLQLVLASSLPRPAQRPAGRPAKRPAQRPSETSRTAGRTSAR